jgi:hypothetical protein
LGQYIQTKRQEKGEKMKVVATRKVCYQGTWYKAGDEFVCHPDHYASLEPAGVEHYKEVVKKKLDKSIKEIKTR